MREQGLWGAYIEAYEDAIRRTPAPHAAWYVAPADNKRFTRLVVASATMDAMEGLNLRLPRPGEAQRSELEMARALPT